MAEFDYRLNLTSEKAAEKSKKAIMGGETEDFCKVPEFAGIFIDFRFEIWYK